MSTFDDVRLPEDIEQGALIGPQFQTTIVPLSSGSEQRNADWQQERVTADISYGIMQRRNPRDATDSFAAVMRFYRARMGRWRGFRFRDWSDWQAQNVPIEMITSTLARLYIDYDENYRRWITRPVPETLSFAGVSDGWQILQGGVIQFNQPQSGTLLASFDFDIPMRFDSDLGQVALTLVDVGSIRSIKLVQISDPPTTDMMLQLGS